MPPGTPPEAQSAPANSQSAPAPLCPSPTKPHARPVLTRTSPHCLVWEALKGESAPLRKLRQAELVQQEEERLEAEARQLHTHVRQARAQALDFGERARHARGKLAQEKEKLEELKEKVLRGRTSVAAWPGGDRGLVDDPEVAALATQVTMEQEWLVQARVTLREVVEERDLELRRLGPAALLDGAEAEANPRWPGQQPPAERGGHPDARSYARRLARPAKLLGKDEMARVSEASYRDLDHIGLQPRPHRVAASTA